MRVALVRHWWGMTTTRHAQGPRHDVTAEEEKLA